MQPRSRSRCGSVAAPCCPGFQARAGTGRRRGRAADRLPGRGRRPDHRPRRRTGRHRHPAPPAVDEPARPAARRPRTAPASGSATSASSPPTATSTRSPPTTPARSSAPTPRSGHAGHKAYWHAAESVLAARRLAGLEPASGASGGRPGARAGRRRHLPRPPRRRARRDRRGVAAAPGPLWFGDPAGPDEDAAAQRAYAPQLIAALTRDRAPRGSAATLSRGRSRLPTASPGKPNSHGADARGMAGQSARTPPVRNPRHDPTAGRSSGFRPGPFHRPTGGTPLR